MKVGLIKNITQVEMADERAEDKAEKKRLRDLEMERVPPLSDRVAPLSDRVAPLSEAQKAAFRAGAAYQRVSLPI